MENLYVYVAALAAGKDYHSNAFGMNIVQI